MSTIPVALTEEQFTTHIKPHLSVAKRGIVVAGAREIVVVPEIPADASFAILASTVGAIAIPVLIPVLAGIRRVGLGVDEDARLADEKGERQNGSQSEPSHVTPLLSQRQNDCQCLGKQSLLNQVTRL